MRYWYYNLKRGIPNFFRNIWIQRKALWGSYWHDYTGLMLYIQGQLKHMEHKQRKDGHSVNSERYCDQMKVCILLLERLIEDDYSIERWEFVRDDRELCGIRMTPKYPFPVHNLDARSEKQRETDKEYLFKIMNKYIHHWWD